MKTTIKQILGYVIMLAIIASIIWFMMYKLEKKVELEQGITSFNQKGVLM